MLSEDLIRISTGNVTADDVARVRTGIEQILSEQRAANVRLAIARKTLDDVATIVEALRELQADLTNNLADVHVAAVLRRFDDTLDAARGALRA